MTKPKTKLAPRIVVRLSPSADNRLLLNIGAGMDVPTGKWLKQPDGRWVMNGGVASTVAVMGKPNSYKSTIMFYMKLTALARSLQTIQTNADAYDSEVTSSQVRISELALGIPDLKDKDIVESGVYRCTDETIMWGDEYYEYLIKFWDEKIKQKKAGLVTTPLYDRVKKEYMQVPWPTFHSIDSWTQLKTENIVKANAKISVDDSKGNMSFAKQGIPKTKMMNVMQTLSVKSGSFMFVTAHEGKSMEVSGPVEKVTPGLKQGTVIKGSAEKVLYLCGHFWQTKYVRDLSNSNTKAPEYPRDKLDNSTPSKDMVEVTINLFRSKSARSATLLPVVVSQAEGLLPNVTELNILRKHSSYYGLVGGNLNFESVFLPGVKMSRTTARKLLEENKKLARAITLTVELKQTCEYHHVALRKYLCSPEDLYNDIKEMGYDWDEILGETRGWATVNDDEHPIPRLTTMDIMAMRLGEYEPKFLKRGKKK